MASQPDDTVLEDLEDEEDDQTDDDVEELVSVDEDDDVEDLHSSSPPSATSPGAAFAPRTVTLALPATNAIPLNAVPSAVAVTPKRPAPLDDARRLFQRLWTDEDEIELLRGFLDYTEQRRRPGPSNSHHPDTSLFYDQIKSKLQLDFNKNQLAEKLRRLKKKYRNACDRINSGKDLSFRSPHDRETFEISRKIWSKAVEDNIEEDVKPNPSIINSEVKLDDKTSNSRKRNRSQFQPTVSLNGDLNDNNKINSDGNIGKLIEETVRSCVSPLFKDLFGGAMGGPDGLRGFGGAAMGQFPGGFGPGIFPLNFGEAATDERWRKQQILELEIYSKRIELAQDQIKVALDELRSMGG